MKDSEWDNMDFADVKDAEPHHPLCEYGIDMRNGRLTAYSECDCEALRDMDKIDARHDDADFRNDLAREG